MKERLPVTVAKKAIPIFSFAIKQGLVKPVAVAENRIPMPLRTLATIVAPSGLGITIAEGHSLPIVLGFGIATGITLLPYITLPGVKE